MVQLDMWYAFGFAIRLFHRKTISTLTIILSIQIANDQTQSRFVRELSASCDTGGTRTVLLVPWMILDSLLTFHHKNDIR